MRRLSAVALALVVSYDLAAQRRMAPLIVSVTVVRACSVRAGGSGEKVAVQCSRGGPRVRIDDATGRIPTAAARWQEIGVRPDPNAEGYDDGMAAARAGSSNGGFAGPAATVPDMTEFVTINF